MWSVHAEPARRLVRRYGGRWSNVSGPAALADRRPAALPKRWERENLRHGHIASPAVALRQLLSLARLSVLDACAVRLPLTGWRLASKSFPSAKGGIISGGVVRLAEAIA